MRLRTLCGSTSLCCSGGVQPSYMNLKPFVTLSRLGHLYFFHQCVGYLLIKADQGQPSPLPWKQPH